MENPFASPSGDPPPAMPPPRAPELPAYQQPGYAETWRPPEDRHRTIPRSLVAACHTSAVSAWVFVACVWSFKAMFDGSFTGFVTFLFGGALLALVLVAALGVAFAALVVAVPLAAIWWGERRERAGASYGEQAALAHLAVAWLVAGYYLVRGFV